MTSSDAPRLAATVLLAGVIGLFVGSFLNVVVYRTPRHLSVAGPRSFCPACRHQLSWWENVPGVSWIALRGRCHTCGQPISVRYPLVEIGTAISFALVTWAWRGSLVSAGYCTLAASMIAVSLIEYGRARAPLSVAAIGTIAAEALLVVAGGWEHHWRVAVGSVIGTGVASLVLLLLRAVDPECLDPRGHGRTALLVAGCWCGGLGAVPAAIGVATWIGAYFLCMVGARWMHDHRRRGLSPPPGDISVLSTPLISALALAMVVSFIVGV